MGYRCWPLVLFVLVFPLPAQGHEACFTDHWTYYEDTHRCIRVFNEASGKTWEEAGDYCATRGTGSDYGVVKRLAKIDSQAENKFVRALFTVTSYNAWIGLHDTGGGKFRWLDSPEEIPKFNASNWEDKTKPYTFIANSGWRGYDGDVELDYFVCYYTAKIVGSITCQQEPEGNGLKFTCTSAPSPCKAKLCQWAYKHQVTGFVTWEVIDVNNMEFTGNAEPYTSTCSFTLPEVQPGKVDVGIQMYPDINGVDVPGNGNAKTTTWEIINVVKPQAAKFYMYGDVINGPNAIVVQGSEDVQVTCFISTGTPAVTSTTMFCETPIDDEITAQAGQPTSYGIKISKVKGNMNGKKCTCRGEHLTGRTEDFTLTFTVAIAPQKPTFTVSGNAINGADVIVVQGSEDVTVTCSITTGSPAVTSTSMSCETPISNGIDSWNGGTTSQPVEIGEVVRDMDGKTCTCWGDHVTGQTDNSILTFKVVTKANTVTCDSDLRPDKLLVSCQTGKIFPEALCTLSYRNGAQGNFNPVSITDFEYSHESKTGNDGLQYYQSSCSMTLTRDDVTFSSGDLTVQVTMNPNIEGMDQGTTPDAFVSTQETVNIAAPSKPQFQRLGKPVDASLPLHFEENDIVVSLCDVNSGYPSVRSVTLSCEFPFNDSDEDNEHTVPGTVYTINKRASREMNGKSCTCTGNHLTGSIESLPVTFNITYPAEINDFTVNENEVFTEVDLNEALALSCEADGYPMPSVQIRKLETNYLDTSTWQSDQSESQVDITLVAQCDLNGRYRCSVGNTLNSQEERRELDIRVRCPPSYCNESSHDIKIAVTPGKSQTVSLCVVAYPMPVLTLYKRSKAGWNTLQYFGGQITQVTKFDSQQTIVINFLHLDSSHLGEYALNFSIGDDTSSGLYVKLTAALTYCGPEESVVHEVLLGKPAALVVCVSAYPSPSSLVMQRALTTGWQDMAMLNTRIKMVVDFDTLTHVVVIFDKVKVTDLGEYRLFDPQDDVSARSYVKFSLSETQPTCPVSSSTSSSSLSTGAIIGLVLGSNLVVVVLMIMAIIACKKLRDKNNTKSTQDSRRGHVNVAFHKPEPEHAPVDSGYVDVPNAAILPSRVLQTSTRDQSEDTPYEGDELDNTEDPKYQTINDTEEEQLKGSNYEILHPDDPNYNNLNREPARSYETIGSSQKGARNIYLVPKTKF